MTRVELNVYAVGAFETGGEPLLPKPITVGKRSPQRGNVVEYLCQISNDENRAFRDLYQREHGEVAFAAAGFSVQQRADLKWVHSAKAGAERLTTYYDFVVVRQFEPPKALAAAALAAGGGGGGAAGK